ncbi:MAG: hypothetical protein VW266_06290, partial [Flavobacteriales bacterium]
SVVKFMKNGCYDYGYMNLTSEKLSVLFYEYGYIFEDLTMFDEFDDEFYLDGSHCNRNVYYGILKKLGVPVNKSFDNDFDINKRELERMKKYFFELKND